MLILLNNALLNFRTSESDRLKAITRSIDAMAFSDVIEKRIRSTNNWSLLGLQAAYSTVMPSHYMKSSFMAMPAFPSYLGRLSNYNKRDRLLQELKFHMNLRVSGSKCALNLDYLEPLRDAIVKPLQDGQMERTVELLNHYCLRKEDIDNIMELATFRGQTDPMSKINPKVKATLTRTMNKDGELLPYAYGVAAKKNRGAKPEDNELGEDEEAVASDEDKDDEDVEKDAMIKVKKSKPKAKTSKKKAASSDDEDVPPKKKVARGRVKKK